MKLSRIEYLKCDGEYDEPYVLNIIEILHKSTKINPFQINVNWPKENDEEKKIGEIKRNMMSAIIMGIVRNGIAIHDIIMLN